MIVKHEFSYFNTCICFHTEQLVARILSNKYIWLLLKYKTDELGTHSDPQQKSISITRDSMWKQTITIQIKEWYITETLLYQNKLFIL